MNTRHFARIDSFTLLTMLERAQPYLISLALDRFGGGISIRRLVGVNHCLADIGHYDKLPSTFLDSIGDVA